MPRDYINYDKDCVQCGNKMKQSSYKGLCAVCGRKKKQLKSLSKSCLCGCGQLITSKAQNSKLQLFAHGHNTGRGRNHKRFKEVIPDGYGYTRTYSPDHPFKDSQNRVKTHRLILEKYLSAKIGLPIFILPYFDVHHKDFDKNNNDPSNLQYLTRREHMSIHMKERNGSISTF